MRLIKFYFKLLNKSQVYEVRQGNHEQEEIKDFTKEIKALFENEIGHF